MGQNNKTREERVVLEVFHNSAVLHISAERSKSVKVIHGGADGTLIYMDWAGHIHRLPPDNPELVKAVAGIVQGTQALLKVSQSDQAGIAA